MSRQVAIYRPMEISTIGMVINPGFIKEEKKEKTIPPAYQIAD